MKYLFWSIALSLFIVSCTKVSKEDSGLTVYPVNLEQAEEIDFHNAVDSFFYVPLETADSNLLGEITQIKIDSMIAVADERRGTLQTYSLEGKLLHVIDKVGTGPGEYVQLNDFALSSKDSCIDVLDGMQKKMISYNLDGTLRKEIKLPFPTGVSRFAKYKDWYVFDQQTRRNEPDWRYSLILLSKQGEVVSKLFPYTRFADILLSPRCSFFMSEDTLNYLPVYCDTVFSLINEHEAVPRYRVDFADKWVDMSYVYGEVKDPMKFISDLQKCDFVCFLNILESDSTIWLDFMYKEDKYCCIINKSPLHISVYLNNEGTECGSILGSVLTVWNDFFVMPVNAELMARYFKLNNAADDNPYLLFVKFK